jgi:hypothetical protein
MEEPIYCQASAEWKRSADPSLLRRILSASKKKPAKSLWIGFFATNIEFVL